MLYPLLLGLGCGLVVFDMINVDSDLETLGIVSSDCKTRERSQGLEDVKHVRVQQLGAPKQ